MQYAALSHKHDSNVVTFQGRNTPVIQIMSQTSITRFKVELSDDFFVVEDLHHVHDIEAKGRRSSKQSLKDQKLTVIVIVFDGTVKHVGCVDLVISIFEYLAMFVRSLSLGVLFKMFLLLFIVWDPVETVRRKGVERAEVGHLS
jgi:hypothetical protein